VREPGSPKIFKKLTRREGEKSILETKQRKERATKKNKEEKEEEEKG